MATLITSGVDHDMGRAHKGLPRQILPTKKDGKFAQPNYIVHPERGRGLVLGMGAIQRPAETMPPSWTPKLDGGPDVLYQGDSTGAFHDRCGYGR